MKRISRSLIERKRDAEAARGRVAQDIAAMAAGRRPWQYPTPCSSYDTHGRGESATWGDGNLVGFLRMIGIVLGITFPVGWAPSPAWVEWLMGWVPGWTSLDPLDTAVVAAWRQSAAEATLWVSEPGLRTVDPPDRRGASGIDLLRAAEVPVRLKQLGNGQVPLCAAEALRRHRGTAAKCGAPAPAPAPRELSLFTGAGGGVLGTSLVGAVTVGYCEWDPRCRSLLERRMVDGLLPRGPIHGDVRAFPARAWNGKVDLLSAGFPCPSFSVAGKQLADKDPRNMWPATMRVIAGVKPAEVLLENVPGLLSKKHGYFGTVLSELDEDGRAVVWECISASDVGAPHYRGRLWAYAWAADGSTVPDGMVEFAHVDAASGKWVKPDGLPFAKSWPRSGLVINTRAYCVPKPKGSRSKKKTRDGATAKANTKNGKPEPKAARSAANKSVRHRGLRGQPNLAVAWRGASAFDGQVVRAVAYCLKKASGDRKLGDMTQVAFLHDDVPPQEAARPCDGRDSAICGNCMHRGTTEGNRSCYVNPGKYLPAVWDHSTALVADEVATSQALRAARVPIRVGSYGDPGAVPEHVVRAIIAAAPLGARGQSQHTAYTHAWRTSPSLRDIAMASVDSPAERDAAKALGWITYRVKQATDPVLPGEIVCPGSAEKGVRLTCVRCLLCAGAGRPGKPVDVVIDVHGSTGRKAAYRRAADLRLGSGAPQRRVELIQASPG